MAEPQLHGNEPAREQLRKTIASFSSFLDELTKQQEKTAKPEMILFLGQSYSSLDKHERAAALLTTIGADAPPALYHLARVLYVRELRLAKNFSKAEAVLQEINGRHIGGPLVSGYGDLRADGSTSCGCWIYSGIFPERTTNRARSRVADTPDGPGTHLGWAYAWPNNVRLLYNRASADADGVPWSDGKRYAWWDEAAGRWAGGDTPDLTVGERVYWSVPVVFTLPGKGVLGRVGTLRVDAGTGELLTDPQTEQEIMRHAEQLAHGFAKSPFDNAGVQYGLKALNRGAITPAQFIDLNRKIGGTDIDDNFIASRDAADPGSLKTLYSSRQVDDGRGLAGVPIISLQDWSETHEIHTSFHSWEMRARLDQANGNHNNQIIWTYPASSALGGVGPDAFLTLKSFLLMDQWLSKVEADHSFVPLAVKVSRDKPLGSLDACFTASDSEIRDPASCHRMFPYYGDARIAAEGPLADNVLACRLQPLDRTSYNVTFTDAQWAEMQQTFPHGVCDWRKPGLGQGVSNAWTTFAAGPGGQPMGPPPVSVPAARTTADAEVDLTRVRTSASRRLSGEALVA